MYCEQTDDVDENEGETKVTIFPNPTNGIIHIEGVTASEVQVYNALGQLVKTAQGTNEINVNGLTEGIYLVRVVDEKGVNYIKRATVM